MADYNVTCPDYRFCEIKHTYMSPCEIWDCQACWWHYDNCTKTPEAPSDHCPYIKCYDLPRPHSHTATIITVVSVIGALAFGAQYVYRRYRRSQERNADPERQAEDAEERVPLLQRCRHLLSVHTQDAGHSAFNRFRAVIFGGRENPAPPEVPQLDDHDDHEPSAPPASAAEGQGGQAPPPYEAINRDPIIRGSSLANDNYRDGHDQRDARNDDHSVEMRELRLASPSRSVPLLDEVPLSHSPR